jgi:hypothetical protein
MKKILFILALLSFTGCALIGGKSRQAVLFDTDVKGAKVYLNGNYIGDTPINYTLGFTNTEIKRQGGAINGFDGYHDISFKKENYEKEDFRVYRLDGDENNFGLCVLDTILLIPLAVDMATGACHNFKPQYFKTLEKKEVKVNIKKNKNNQD